MRWIIRLAQTLLLASTAVFCGCGTIHNLIDGPSIYGGVDKAISSPTIDYGVCSDPVLLIIVIPAMCFDVAFSAIADTAILPFTIPYELLQDDTVEPSARETP